MLTNLALMFMYQYAAPTADGNVWVNLVLGILAASGIGWGANRQLQNRKIMNGNGTVDVGEKFRKDYYEFRERTDAALQELSAVVCKKDEETNASVLLLIPGALREISECIKEDTATRKDLVKVLGLLQRELATRTAHKDPGGF